MAAGTIYTELDIDLSKFQAKQKTIVNQISKLGKDSEVALTQGFMNLGVTADNVFRLMAVSAQKSYEKITNSAKTTAAEQVRAQSAMVAKINSLNMEMTKNPLYETLGIRSVAAIEAQKKAVMESFNTISQHVQKGSQDWINIEKAKNAKLKELNKEMVGEHDMSMAAMTRAVLRFYAAYYVISTAARTVVDFISSGVKAIDDMNLSVVSVAAQITTMQGATGNVVENYKKNVEYAKALIPVLQEIDANSFANLSQIQKMNMAMTNQGIILDINNQKQIESFTALTNAVALFTQGQDKEKQASQEIRSLMSGQVRAGDMVAMQMDALIKRTGEYKGGLKELVAEGKKHGDTLERMKPYLIGIVAASGDIQKTWMAVGSSIETTWNIIQRGLFKDVYKDLVEGGADAVKWIKENQDEIIRKIKETYDAFAFSIKSLIALFSVLAVAAVSKMVIAGDALAWFQLRWEAMVDTVTLSTSKLALSMSVLVGAFAGFSLGTYLSNNFEEARIAGVAMVYGVINAWEWFIKQLKLGWEYIKLAKDYLLTMDSENRAIITQTHNLKIKIIEKEYALAKELRDKWRDEQFKSVTDMAIKEAKIKADVNKKAPMPSVSPMSEQLTDTFKDKKDQLRDLQQAHKAYYDEQVKDAEQAAKLSQRAGQDEFKTIKDLYDAKQVALNDYLEVQRKDAEKMIGMEYEKAKAAGESFEYQKTLQAEYDKIYAQYHKDWHALEGERVIANEDAASKTLSTMAELYKALGGYSNDALESYIANLQEKYRQDARYASATKEQKLLLEKALAKEVADIRHKAFIDETSKYSAMLGSLQSTFTTIGDMYDKNSDEYAKMQEAAKAMIVLQNAVAVANAVSAVAAAAAAPFPAGFVAMAAMAAAMASLLATVGVSFGGGGSVSAPSAAYGQNTTVLGGANNQGSESIANSYKLLEDTYKMEDTKLTGIYNQMKNLNQNITGLVNNILRTGGDFTGTSLKTAGFAENNFAKITPNYWMNELSGSFYNKITFGISGAVDNFLGKIGNKIFGGSSETSLTASGISVGAGSLGDLINGTKLLVQSFADLRKETDGGWFHSDRTEIWTEYKTLDESISNMMTNVFKSMGTTMLELNKSLGTNANEAAIKAYQFDIGKIDLKGLDGEAISKKISEVISNVGDKMASDLFGSIVGTYQKINEGLLQTAIRLMVNKEVVLDTLAMTGQAFVGSTADIIAFSESIINMAGDLDALRTAAETYYDKFFTDAEKQARLQDQLIKGMSGVNQILPAARDGYRGLLESLDLNTDAGKEAYITMLKLAKSADEYYTALEDVAKKQDEVVASLRKQSQTITQWLSDLNRSPLAPSNSMEAVSTEYNRLKGLAKGTGATEADTSSYLNYAKEYLDYMRKYGGDYKALYASVVSDVQGLQSTIDTKVSDAQLAAATALSSAAALLGSAGNALINAATAQAIISAGGQATGYYSPKVGWTGGAQLYTTPGQTLQDAINNAIQMGYTQENPWAGGLAATATAEEVIANTTTNQDVWDWDNWSNSQTLINAGLGGYADGGYHEGGWRVVGERGPELEFTPPSRIFNNKQTKTMLDNLGLNGGSNGPGREEIHIHIHNETDGREVSEIIAKYIPRNGNLSAAIKKAAA